MPIDYSLYAIIISLILAAIVAGNNLFTCSGTIIAGRIVGRRTGILVALMGYILGLLLQGSLLHAGLFSLLPISSAKVMLAGILAATVIFVVSQLLKAPQSLSIVLVSALIGSSLAAGYGINVQPLYLMVATWILAPLVSMVLALFILRTGRRQHKKVWRSLEISRVLLIATSFLMAYTLGANTMGLLYSSVGYGSIYIMLLFIAAISIGSFAFSRRIIRNVGEELMPIRYRNAMGTQVITAALVEIATFLSVPLSNTQVFMTSLLGSGLSYKTRIIESRSLKIVALAWIIGALACLGIGYALVFVGI
jgi:PiT family inorganic phosphate transporter